MKIISELNDYLTQRRTRFIYLILFILLIALVIISYKTTFYDITDILDYIELSFVLLTLIYLYLRTNKKEINRYKENYQFYKDKYTGHSLLSLENNSKDKIYSSSINYSEIDTSNIQSLDNIIFTLNDCEYQLPALIQEQAKDILSEKFNIQEKTDYNGLTLSLNDVICEDGKTLELKFCKSCYYNYLLTNMIPEYKILANLTIRDYLEASGKKILNSLKVSLAENHLGISSLVSILVKTKGKSEEYIIIPQRSHLTTVFKGQLAPSISGAANIDTCSENSTISIKNFFKQEIEEELIPILHELCPEATNNFKEDFIKNAKFIGMSRELKRLGKPEMFFFYECKHEIDLDKIENKNIKIKHEQKYYGIAMTDQKHESSIDLIENNSFLLITPKDLIQGIRNIKCKSHKNSSYKGKEIYASLLKKELKVSESLLVNIIYMQQRRIFD